MEESKSTLTQITKILGLTAIITGIFGVSYQKGMIIQMELGNLNGNYDVREIFNSAIFGYLDFFEKVSKIKILDLMSANWWISAFFVVIGFLLPFLYHNRNNIDEYRDKAKEHIRATLKKIIGSYIWSPLVLATFGVFVNFVAALISYSFLMLFGIALLPALLGYVVGTSKIDSVMDKPPCVAISEEASEQKYVRQCTQVKINGIKIRGDILLENNDAYFLHLNESFLYVRKDGTVCASSKFKLSEEIENKETFEFEHSQVDSLCNSDGALAEPINESSQ